MPTAYIEVGSNIDPEANIRAALRLLKKSVKLVAVSTFYRTEPVGMPGAPMFVNGIVKIETDLPGRTLKYDVLRAIEEDLGRVRTGNKYQSRPIDLDIAIYGDECIDEPGLVIPDPEITSRAFVAVPLHELDPDLALPGSGIRLADVVSTMGIASMEPLEDFTRLLRREME